MKESALQNKITSYLKKQNRFYIKTQGGMAGVQIGTPDIITIDDNGTLVGLELKRPDHKGSYGVTIEQKHQGEKIKQFNGRWYVIDSFTQLIDLELFEKEWSDQNDI